MPYACNAMIRFSVAAQQSSRYYVDFFSPKTAIQKDESAINFPLSVSCAIFRSVSLSCITPKSHGWRFLAVGAWLAHSIASLMITGSTESGLNFRTLCRDLMTVVTMFIVKDVHNTVIKYAHGAVLKKGLPAPYTVQGTADDTGKDRTPSAKTRRFCRRREGGYGRLGSFNRRSHSR